MIQMFRVSGVVLLCAAAPLLAVVACTANRGLVIVSPDDSVVSAAVTKDAFTKLDAPTKRLIEFEDAQDPSRHVLAGDILSPGTTETVADTIVEFVRKP